MREIHEEIRQVQAQPLSDREAGSLKTIVAMPGFIRRLMLWVVSKNPSMRK